MINWEFGFWSHLTVAVLGLATPLIWTRLKNRGAFFNRDAANEFGWLSKDERDRLNFHLNREKSLLDYWRKMIDQLRIVQYYCSIYSVVGPILMAARAPLTTTSESSRQITPFLSLISIHLAITLVCSNRSRSRRLSMRDLDLNLIFTRCFIVFRMHDPISGKQMKIESMPI